MNNLSIENSTKYPNDTEMFREAKQSYKEVACWRLWNNATTDVLKWSYDMFLFQYMGNQINTVVQYNKLPCSEELTGRGCRIMIYLIPCIDIIHEGHLFSGFQYERLRLAYKQYPNIQFNFSSESFQSDLFWRCSSTNVLCIFCKILTRSAIYRYVIGSLI